MRKKLFCCDEKDSLRQKASKGPNSDVGTKGILLWIFSRKHFTAQMPALGACQNYRMSRGL